MTHGSLRVGAVAVALAVGMTFGAGTASAEPSAGAQPSKPSHSTMFHRARAVVDHVRAAVATLPLAGLLKLKAHKKG
jgi:hypothetical protein